LRSQRAQVVQDGVEPVELAPRALRPDLLEGVQRARLARTPGDVRPVGGVRDLGHARRATHALLQRLEAYLPWPAFLRLEERALEQLLFAPLPRALGELVQREARAAGEGEADAPDHEDAADHGDFFGSGVGEGEG